MPSKKTQKQNLKGYKGTKVTNIDTMCDIKKVIESYFDSPTYADLKIIIKENGEVVTSYDCHKMIVAAQSRLIKDLCDTFPEEKNLTLDIESGDMLKDVTSILKYCYTGTIEDDVMQRPTLKKLAIKYQFTSICEQMFETMSNIDKVPSVEELEELEEIYINAYGRSMYDVTVKHKDRDFIFEVIMSEYEYDTPFILQRLPRCVIQKLCQEHADGDKKVMFVVCWTKANNISNIEDLLSNLNLQSVTPWIRRELVKMVDDQCDESSQKLLSKLLRQTSFSIDQRMSSTMENKRVPVQNKKAIMSEPIFLETGEHMLYETTLELENSQLRFVFDISPTFQGLFEVKTDYMFTYTVIVTDVSTNQVVTYYKDFIELTEYIDDELELDSTKLKDYIDKHPNCTLNVEYYCIRMLS